MIQNQKTNLRAKSEPPLNQNQLWRHYDDVINSKTIFLKNLNTNIHVDFGASTTSSLEVRLGAFYPPPCVLVK